MHMQLRKSLLVSALALGLAVVGETASAGPADNTIHWQSVIGIAQANNVVGAGSGASTGGGSPWSALGGHVNVDLTTGDVDFDVHGLVLAGGNSIGTPDSVFQVKGTLVCDTDGSGSGGNSVLVNTPLVDLGEQGDARFHGNVGPLPAACTTQPDIAFLIRTGGGRWIANGTVLH